MSIAPASSKRRWMNPRRWFRHEASTYKGAIANTSCSSSSQTVGSHQPQQTPSFKSAEEGETTQHAVEDRADSGSRVNKPMSVAKNTFIETLDLLVRFSDGMPIPIKGPLSLVQGLVTQAKRIGANRESLNELERHCHSLATIIKSGLSEVDESVLPEPLSNMPARLSN
ncbi:hypothetical protein CC2G_012471 [Coprinopsis cinerea AmutBmut pab1-1]|nr:hypothetical protein CC2G_012471 [Coprinopsis cinerea AmutBmut pab1-1]